MNKIVTLAFGLCFALALYAASNAQQIGGGGGSSGGGTLTANSTATSGFGSGDFMYNSSSKIQTATGITYSAGGLFIADPGAATPGIQLDDAGAHPVKFIRGFGGAFVGGVYINSDNTQMIGIGTNTTGGAPFFGNPLLINAGGGNGALGFVASDVRGFANADVGIGRNAAGVLEINDGNSVASAGALAAFKATTGTLTTLASDSGHTTNTVCVVAVTGLLEKGSGTGGICAGTSSVRFKHDVAERVEGLDHVLALRPVSYRYNKGYGNDGEKELYGFLAEDVAQVIPALAGSDTEGKPSSVDYVGMIPVLVKAIQEQQKTIDCLRQQKQGC